MPYPYNAGDRVMLGIRTWPSGHWPSGRPEDFTRYFVPATVLANDRQDGRLATLSDRPHSGGHGYEVQHFEDFNGEEVVAYDESLPMTAADAHARLPERF